MNGDNRRDDASPSPRRRWRLPVSWKVLVPTVAALGLGLGGAIAAGSVGSGNTITGCYLTPLGAYTSEQAPGLLRVIDPSDTTESNPAVSTCTTGEAQITWNEQGVPGANGTPGATGPQGPQGPPGATGATGPAGGVSAGSGSATDVTMELTPTNANLGGLGAVPEGETQDTNQQNQIFDVDSFDLGASNQVSIGSAAAGAGAGKATFQKFVITKPVDKYSSDLFEDLVKGTTLKSAEIVVRKAGGNGMAVPLAQYLMTHVAITDIHVSGTGRTPTETIQGEYAQIQFVIYEQMPDGQTKVGSTGGWSQVTNTQVPAVGKLTSKRHRHH
jgi:type VI secretion system secreted protein Hcp